MRYDNHDNGGGPEDDREEYIHGFLAGVAVSWLIVLVCWLASQQGGG